MRLLELEITQQGLRCLLWIVALVGPEGFVLNSDCCRERMLGQIDGPIRIQVQPALALRLWVEHLQEEMFTCAIIESNSPE